MRKAFIIVGVVLTVVGLIIIAAIGGANGLAGLKGMFSHDLSAADEVKELEISEDVVNLNVVANSYSVYLRKSEDEKLYVKYVSQLPDGVTLDVEKTAENSVTITQTDVDKILGIMFGNAYKNRFLVVEIPENGHFALSVQCNAGKLDVSGVANLQNVDCKLDAGGILFDGAKAQNVGLETSAGSVTLKNTSAANVTVVTDAGAVSVENFQCATLDVQTDAGSIKIAETQATDVVLSANAGSVNCNAKSQTLKITTDAGSINFKTQAKDIALKCNTGSVHGTILGAQANEFDIVVEKGVGSSNVSTSRNESATGKLSVEVDVGSISISFDKEI
ncbi:MAG: DUF4097 family beta strand repeat-containing protein [Candidatus Fimimonas sp.]